MHTEWDDAKAAVNLQKHGVSFLEAATVFDDPTAVTAYDPSHSAGEDRFLTGGVSSRGRLLIIRHTDRGDAIRIIGARGRPATSEGTTAMPDPDPSDMLPEYDFTAMKGVVRGKYAGRVTSTPRMVRLADDLADAFADDEAVNEALRDALARSVAAADR